MGARLGTSFGPREVGPFLGSPMGKKGWSSSRSQEREAAGRGVAAEPEEEPLPWERPVLLGGR